MAKKKNTQAAPRVRGSGEPPVAKPMTPREAIELVKRTIRFRPPGTRIAEAVDLLDRTIPA